MEFTRIQYLNFGRKAYCLSCPDAELSASSKGKLSVGCKKQRECKRLLLFADNYKQISKDVICDLSSTKICKKCKIEKPLTEFRFHPSCRDNHTCLCKSCLMEKKLDRPDESIKIAEKSRNLTFLKEERELKALFYHTGRLLEQREFINFGKRLRRKMDNEYREKMDKIDKVRYADPRHAYLAKKYLKRYLSKLEKHEAIIQEIERLPAESLTYKLQLKLERYKLLREQVLENIRIAREGIELKGESEFYKSRMSEKDRDNDKK